jgi:thioredoxin-disulfide reductase
MKNYDLIIIGGGPAGITAGIYAARQKIKTLLITKDFGGQIARKAVAIENYPGLEKISGLKLIKKFTDHLKKVPVDIVQDAIVKVKKTGQIFLISIENKKTFQAKAVIVASGADPRPLEVPGEKKFIGKGVSYCTACDAPLFAQKIVAVAGGGNSGFEAAIALSKWSKKIYILERGSEPRADEINQEMAKKMGKVEVLTNVVLKEIKGKDFVNSVVYQDKKRKKEIILSVDGIFVEIGSQPATSFVKKLVDFNEKDEIIVNLKTGETRTPGLFSAGDADDVPYKQIVIAAGEGAKAALAASNYLQKINSI